MKAFTDGLRMELEAEGAPISVTLIKPSGIDTPYPEHARNDLGSQALRLPPPVYDPHLVGKAILFAAEHPKRELVVGFGGWLIGAHGASRRLTDYAMERPATPRRRPTPCAKRRGARQPLQAAAGRRRIFLVPGREPRRTSLFLEAQMHPVATAALVAGFGLALALCCGRRRPTA